jgi:hypothetical protein
VGSEPELVLRGGYDFDAILLSGGGNDVVDAELKEFAKKEVELQIGGRVDWVDAVPEVVRKHLRLDILDKALSYAMADLGLVVKLRGAFCRAASFTCISTTRSSRRPRLPRSSSASREECVRPSHQGMMLPLRTARTATNTYSCSHMASA